MPEDNIFDTRPTRDVIFVSRPAWWTEIAAAKNGSLVQLHHPVHGWLTFLFPPEDANTLGMGLMKQSALCDYFAGTLPPSTVTVN